MTTKSYIVIKDKAQELTNKTIDADSNVISNIETGNFKSQATTEAGKSFGVKSDGTIGLINAGNPAVDDTTVEINSDDKLQVKDGGISLAKLATQLPSDLGKVAMVKEDGTWYLRVPNGIPYYTIEYLNETRQTVFSAIPAQAPTIAFYNKVKFAEGERPDSLDEYFGVFVIKTTSSTGTMIAYSLNLDPVKSYMCENLSGTWGNWTSVSGDYLPLAGGTTTGTITNGVPTGLFAASDNEANKLEIWGGNNAATCAQLQLNDIDNGGNFELIARTSNDNYHILEGTADGELTWDDTPLVFGNVVYVKLYGKDATRTALLSGVGDTGVSYYRRVVFTAAESPTSSASDAFIAIVAKSTESDTEGVILAQDIGTGNLYTSKCSSGTWSAWVSYLPTSGGTMTGAITFKTSGANVITGTSGTTTEMDIRVRTDTSNTSQLQLYDSGTAKLLAGNGSTRKDLAITSAGALTFASNLSLGGADDSRSIVCGGASESGGSSIILKGKSKDAGQFILKAYDGTNTGTMIGGSDGGLTWQGNSLVGVQASPTAGTGISFTKGYCNYVRVGNMVFVFGIISIAVGTYAFNQNILTGLPTAAYAGTGALTYGNASYRLRISAGGTAIHMLDSLTLTSAGNGCLTFMYLAA